MRVCDLTVLARAFAIGFVVLLSVRFVAAAQENGEREFQECKD
jgi:hypothetical protein